MWTQRGWRLDNPRLARRPSAGGGVGQGAPRLRVAWCAHELVFIARGEAPYKLAFGNVMMSPAPNSVETLFARLRHDHGAQVLGLALLSGSLKVVNRAFLEHPPAPVPWQRITLWAVLVTGFSDLGWLAFSLLHEITPA
jgi:hypothetical protein